MSMRSEKGRSLPIYVVEGMRRKNRRNMVITRQKGSNKQAMPMMTGKGKSNNMPMMAKGACLCYNR
jgi:hypothetical protein